VNEKKTSKFSYLKEIDLKNQTVFQQAELHFTTGLNVIIGENGTGKSHLLKLAYSILAWIGACQSTYKKGFPCPFCSLTTAPGCNALAALRPLSLPLRGKAQLPQWLYAVWHFSKKVPWLPETTRHRLSASLTRSG
jgi:hypothetical protein